MKVLALVSMAALALAYPANWFDSSKTGRGKCVAPKIGDTIMGKAAVAHGGTTWTTKLYKSGDSSKTAVTSLVVTEQYVMEFVNAPANAQYLFHVTGGKTLNPPTPSKTVCTGNDGATDGTMAQNPAVFFGIVQSNFTGDATITVAATDSFANAVQVYTVSLPTSAPAPTCVDYFNKAYDACGYDRNGMKVLDKAKACSSACTDAIAVVEKFSGCTAEEKQGLVTFKASVAQTCASSGSVQSSAATFASAATVIAAVVFVLV
mmetsp:Transcript_27612/g.54278  ORF Transcript_27612/g.54278 Transcript_27612/m.54278 type:complete len:262 (-) Transcript_27612:181-966(-)|eukprot:CAMPEP_0175139792 /NCGR_PEP_ID=MMETSP0087-20121206/11110_1 /TAXON_ID=136419 /ORGANISM="Unknown Unknown, Strain D1" /LENGTH=261 /DNA_ID=CAMNT_0016422863 /DNA_START=58 /DNA_END=843 /DNA_ORIENTATION=+